MKSGKDELKYFIAIMGKSLPLGIKRKVLGRK